MFAATGESDMKWGAQVLNGVAGHHWPPGGDGPHWWWPKAHNLIDLTLL